MFKKDYSLAGQIDELLNTAVSDNSVISKGTASDTSSPIDASAATVAKWRIKLLEASLSNFDGHYENWLSFKNAFVVMIDTRSELSEVEKLQYLQSALTGEQMANKIKILSIEGTNYRKAWDLLKRVWSEMSLDFTTFIFAYQFADSRKRTDWWLIKTRRRAATCRIERAGIRRKFRNTC